MKFSFIHKSADIYVPDGSPLEAALARGKVMGVGAHPDDLEFMAFSAIAQCYGRRDVGFLGVTATDGAGSIRPGALAGLSSQEWVEMRKNEQKGAAKLGRYAAQIQLMHSSASAKDMKDEGLGRDLAAIFDAVRPEEVYTHSLADRHPSHRALALKVIQALRRLPKEARPSKLMGCESWGSLDWLEGEDKVAMECLGPDGLEESLLKAFPSQISPAKPYDEGILGRRRANAVFLESHFPAPSSGLAFGMDLVPLMQNDKLEPVELLGLFLDRFRATALAGLEEI